MPVVPSIGGHVETRYKIRAALTVAVFVGGPILYGLTSHSDDALYTLGAVLSIPYILAWVLLLSLVGTGIEHIVRLLLKKLNKGAG